MGSHSSYAHEPQNRFSNNHGGSYGTFNFDNSQHYQNQLDAHVGYGNRSSAYSQNEFLSPHYNQGTIEFTGYQNIGGVNTSPSSYRKERHHRISAPHRLQRNKRLGSTTSGTSSSKISSPQAHHITDQKAGKRLGGAGSPAKTLGKLNFLRISYADEIGRPLLLKSWFTFSAKYPMCSYYVMVICSTCEKA
jgi:hypothetical protein